MKEYYADKACLKIIRLFVLVLTFLLILAAAYFFTFIPIIMIITCSVFFLTGFFIVFIYLPVYFKKIKYYVSDEKIIKISGFYFTKTQTISLCKIQYTVTMSAPFFKLCGLNFIFLYACGGVMPIMFLNERDFLEIRCNLIKCLEAEV